MKKKVLYILTKTDIGGAQKYVNDLAANLDKNLFEVEVLYGGKDIKWLSNKLYPWMFFLNDWMAVFEMAKIYALLKPDIIHLNSSKTGVVGSLAAWFYKTSLKLNPKPDTLCPRVVFTAHGWVFNPTNYISRFARAFYIFLHKFSGRFQDKIINVSEYDKQIALQEKIVSETKLTKIYNGIDPNISFLDKETARDEISRKLKVEGNEINTKGLWIGSIGRLTKEKNYQTLIRAAEKLPNISFFIIGAGSEKKYLKDLILKLDIKKRFFLIEPNGYDAKFLKMLDVFVMSSIKEGFPYVLLEAMAAEVPVVITKAGGMPEAIQDGKTGFIVAQKNPSQLANAIKEILSESDICNRFKKEAKKRSMQVFNLNKMIKNTEELYRQV